MKTAFNAAEPRPADPPRIRRSRVFPQPGKVLATASLLWISVIGAGAFIWAVEEIVRTENREFGILALAGLGTFVAARAVVYALARNLACPLCHGTVMHEKSCQKHVEALRVPPFSYRSSVAASVLCCGTFRCMYCGTGYRLKK